MALMPMPPMPMMWKVPISRGICMMCLPSVSFVADQCRQLRGSLMATAAFALQPPTRLERISSSVRSARRPTASGRPSFLAASAACCKSIGHHPTAYRRPAQGAAATNPSVRYTKPHLIRQAWRRSAADRCQARAATGQGSPGARLPSTRPPSRRRSGRRRVAISPCVQADRRKSATPPRRCRLAR